MSNLPTWAEILEKITDLEKRLNLLEKKRGIQTQENERTAPLITDEKLVKLWQECDRDPLKFANKLTQEAPESE